MKKIFFLIIAAISFVFYIIAPAHYNQLFCIMCLLLFLPQTYIIIKNDIKYINLLNFNLLFLFSFFACTYVFPVFLIGNKSIIGEILSNRMSSYDTINRSVALCTFAISIYNISYVIFRRYNKKNILRGGGSVEARTLFKNSKLFAIFASLGILLVTYNFMNTVHDVNIEVTDAPYLFQLFYYITPIYFVSSAIYLQKEMGGSLTIREYIRNNLTIIVVLLITSVLFLIIGDRAPIMSIGITFLSTIALFVKKLKPITLVGLFFVGIILMYALRETRTGSSSLSSGGFGAFVEASQSSLADNTSAWDVLSDLVVINYELNAGMDYIDHYGHLNPTANAIIFISSPLPFVPSLLTHALYGKEPKEVSSGFTISQYTETAAGNHCVIDVYMPYGIIGIVLFFFLLGLLVAKVTNGVDEKKLFAQIFYIYLLSIAIFVARNSIGNLYRSLVLSFIVYYILIKINNKKKGAVLQANK